MTLDLTTLYVTQVATFTLITGVLLLIGMRYRNEHALRTWGIAGQLACAGLVLVALREAIPSWLSIEIANIILFSALAMTWLGCRALTPAPLPWRTALIICAIASGALLIISSAPQYFQHRITLYSSVYLVFHTLCLHALWQNPNRTRLGYRISMLLISLTMFTHVLRLLLGITQSDVSPQNAAQLVSINFANTLLEYGKILSFIFICVENLEMKLYRQAMNDSLTGLYNRRAFYEKAEQHHAANLGQAQALLVMDLDWFKRINDTHGHLAGDVVLVHFAELLRQQMSPFDAIYGRNGGEEFVVLLSGEAARHAQLIAESLRETLANSPITIEDGQTLQQTVSIGTIFCHSCQIPLRQLFMHADLALYEAKAQGRNRVCVSTE